MPHFAAMVKRHTQRRVAAYWWGVSAMAHLSSWPRFAATTRAGILPEIAMLLIRKSLLEFSGKLAERD